MTQHPGGSAGVGSDDAHPHPQYHQAQYPQPEYPQAQYPQPEYPQTFYQQPQYPQAQYPQPEYPQAQYPQPEYPQTFYQQPQYPQGQHPASQHPGLQPQRTDGVAVAALLLSVIGFGLFGIVLAVVSLVRTRRTGARGRGLAIAAIAVAVLWAAGLVALVSLRTGGGDAGGNSGTAAASAAPSASSGVGQRVRPVELKVGDCLQHTTKHGLADFKPVACTVPHNGEVLGEYTITGGLSYPGEDVIAKEADTRCAAFVPKKTTSGTRDLTLFYLYPQQADWFVSDRKAQCLIESKGVALTAPLARR